MATNRFGYSDDFVLKNGKVGINTAEPQATLDVQGTIKATNLKTTGVTTVTAYEGFLNADHKINESTTITNGASLSGEIIVGTGVTVTVGAVGVATALVGIGTNYTGSSNIDTTDVNVASQGAIESLKVYNTFNPPVGGTNDRPIKAKPGQLYYNQDFKTVEFWDGYNWRQVDYTTRSGRGVFGGGWDSSNNTSLLHTLQVHTLGNSEFFGDLTIARRNPGGRVSSSIRGIFSGGFNTAPGTDRIDYITFSSSGTAEDFGNLLTNGTYAIANAALSSSTRGIMSGGVAAPGVNQNVIQYIEIPTTGDAIDFGDLVAVSINGQAVASPTKGLFCGGGPTGRSTIQSITISSRGDAVEVGDLTQAIFYGGCVTNGTRGIVGGGEYVPSPTFTHTSLLDYITITSAGNAQEFGDLTTKRSRIASVESITRGVFVGSVANGGSGTHDNTIDYIPIASAGNAQDFGDLVNNNNIQVIGCSDSHGGLGGF